MRLAVLSVALLVSVLISLGPIAPSVSLAQSGPSLAPPLVLRFLDVGDGDATWVTTPDGHNILIDCGSVSNSKRLLVQLAAYGIEQVDVLAISQPRPNNVDGCRDLMSHPVDLPVESVLLTGQSSTSSSWKSFLSLSLAPSSPTRRYTVRAGDYFDLGGDPNYGPDDSSRRVTARVYSPTPRFDELPLDDYDDSLVLSIEYMNHRVLFVGDMHQAGVNAVIASGWPLNSEILKIANHAAGAANTRDFLARVNPQAVVLSYSNLPRAPRPDSAVLARVAALNANLWTTAERGTVTVYVADQVWISPERAN